MSYFLIFTIMPILYFSSFLKKTREPHDLFSYLFGLCFSLMYVIVLSILETPISLMIFDFIQVFFLNFLFFAFFPFIIFSFVLYFIFIKYLEHTWLSIISLWYGVLSVIFPYFILITVQAVDIWFFCFVPAMLVAIFKSLEYYYARTHQNYNEMYSFLMINVFLMFAFVLFFLVHTLYVLKISIVGAFVLASFLVLFSLVFFSIKNSQN